MQYRELIGPIKTIQIISSIISLLINCSSIFLILTKSPKQMGAYKYLMFCISLNEIFYSIVDVLLEPLHYSHGAAFLVVTETTNKPFSPEGLLILNAIYWGLFGASMAMFSIHFIYRWLVVTESPLLKSFSNWKLFLWLLIPFSCGTTWLLTGYFLCAPTEASDRHIHGNLRDSFGLVPEEYVYLGPYLYEVTETGEIILHFGALIGLSIMSGSVMLSISIVLYFGFRCYDKIRRQVATSTASEKYRKLQNQLFYALVFQTLIPFLLMHLPVTIIMAFVFLNIDLENYTAPVSITIVLYPAVDPIPTLLIVENYRRTILDFFKCSPKSNSVSTSTRTN